MARDPEKARAANRRYRRRRKAEQLGDALVDVDLRGRHANHRRAADHPRWNGERILSSEGYVKVRVGRAHPLADPNGYAYEHTLVAVTALGRPLHADEVVHHRSGDKTDNRWENLQVTSRGAHAADHNADRLRDAQGRFAS